MGLPLLVQFAVDLLIHLARGLLVGIDRGLLLGRRRRLVQFVRRRRRFGRGGNWRGLALGGALLVDAMGRFALFLLALFPRSEEHTSELQSLRHLVWRLLL